MCEEVFLDKRETVFARMDNITIILPTELTCFSKTDCARDNTLNSFSPSRIGGKRIVEGRFSFFLNNQWTIERDLRYIWTFDIHK